MTIVLQRISEGEDQDTSSGFGAVESEYGNLPLRQLSYHARMLGMSVQTTILQTFYNPFDEPIEANYIFPLDYGQAVIACEMRIATRVIQAELKERGQARREYNEAIRNGHRAALLEENRPETFSLKVGNIPPGEAIQICIQTVSQLSIVHGEWTLRLPLVVAPRYTSGIPLPRTSSGNGICHDTDQVPDASCVTPPTWLPGFASPIDLRLVVDIEVGQLACAPDWATQLKSSLHTALVKVDAGRAGCCRVELLPAELINRDFILRGQVLDLQASSSVVCETAPGQETASHQSKGTGKTTFAITIVPPRKNTSIPRQVVFLLDRSGSMTGWKFEAARRGLCRLLDRLNQQDHFQMIVFNEEVNAYHSSTHSSASSHEAWLPATDANRFQAIRWLNRLHAHGGTEMGKALDAALRTGRSSFEKSAAPNRAIVLITDGQITGEDALLRLLDSMPQYEVPRLFCMGVDRAVNGSVLERLTRRTHGTYELVESENRLDEVLQRFSDEIASPSLTHLSISDQTYSNLNLAPGHVEALYAGRSQTIYGRTDQPSLTLFIRGRLADGRWYEETLEMSAASAATSQSCLRALWGKQRVRELEDKMFGSGDCDNVAKQQIVNCSLECGVLSRLTAFVAVDRAEKITPGQQPHSVVIPAELPEGWSRQWLRLDAASLMRAPRSAQTESSSVPMPSFESIAEQAAVKLLQAGGISEVQLVHARSLAAQRNIDVCHALIKLHYVSCGAVAQAIAAMTHMPYVPVSQLTFDPAILALIPESVARENHVLPVSENSNSITVAIANPHDLDTIEKLRFILNRNINFVVGASDEIGDAINRLYGQIEGESAECALPEFINRQIDFTETEDGFTLYDAPPSQLNVRGNIKRRGPVSSPADSRSGELFPRGMARKVTSSPTGREYQRPDDIGEQLARFVDELLEDAYQLGATHVLVSRSAAKTSTIYLIDGRVVNRDQVPRRLWLPILNRLKLLAQLDIANFESFQTGAFKTFIRTQEVELTVYTARDSFLIELPRAKELSTIPPEVEQWLNEQRASTP